MFHSKSLLIGGLALLLGAVFVPSWFSVTRAEVGERMPTHYWIGVQVAPVPKLFLAHFGVEDESESRIAVEHVVPESPAAKSGLKRGDILLRFGEKEIHTLPDLIEQVSAMKETATKLDVIRKGAKTTLTVTPVPRPDASRPLPGMMDFWDMPPVPLAPIPQFGLPLPIEAFPRRDPLLMLRQMEDLVRRMQGGDDGEFMQPDVPQGIDAAGKQLSVVMQTDQDGKSFIKVVRVLKDGDVIDRAAWEVESVDELPEEIRADVNKLLGR